MSGERPYEAAYDQITRISEAVGYVISKEIKLLGTEKLLNRRGD